MRAVILIATVTIATVALLSPAAAKTCREPLAVSAQTRVAGEPAAREKRAADHAVAKWRDAARWKYGLLYRFWSRAEAKATECRSTPKAATCTVTATPCRLL